jgi:Zn-dependent protease with chaperone function
MAMRFFDHQASARARIRRLTLLFLFVALPATIAGVHLALSIPWVLARWFLHLPLAYPAAFLPANVGITAALILGGWWIEHSNVASGGIRLAEKLGARAAQPALRFDEGLLTHVVSEICTAAQMPRPAVMVLPNHDAINAFATGFAPRDWAITVSDGALRYLTRTELQGLVAHECSHLREGDTELNMQLIGMVSGLQMIWGFGRSLRPDPDGDSEDELGSVVLGAFGAVFGSLIMAAGFVGWLAGRVLQAAVSRQCEYLADARAMQWTRDDSVGRVLRKRLTQERQEDSWTPRTAAVQRVAHLWLASEDADSSNRQDWLDTHPPIRERIKRIYGHFPGALPLEAAGAADARPAV